MVIFWTVFHKFHSQIKTLILSILLTQFSLMTFHFRMMVGFSWFISLLLASPQAIMFRKLKHPAVEFYQCTTTLVVEEYANLVVEDGNTKFVLIGLDSNTIYIIYHLSFLFFVFFFPLTFLIITHIVIIKLIQRCLLSVIAAQ